MAKYYKIQKKKIQMLILFFVDMMHLIHPPSYLKVSHHS